MSREVFFALRSEVGAPGAAARSVRVGRRATVAELREALYRELRATPKDCALQLEATGARALCDNDEAPSVVVVARLPP